VLTVATAALVLLDTSVYEAVEHTSWVMLCKAAASVFDEQVPLHTAAHLLPGAVLSTADARLVLKRGPLGPVILSPWQFPCVKFE
jgi:hypothetical protein